MSNHVIKSKTRLLNNVSFVKNDRFVSRTNVARANVNHDCAWVALWQVVSAPLDRPRHRQPWFAPHLDTRNSELPGNLHTHTNVS
jgi:hypothetical protein